MVRARFGGVASTPPPRPFFKIQNERRFRMETKEIAMQKTTKLLGTVCVLAAAFMASPAAAASLTDWTGVIVANYEHSNGNNSTTVNTGGLGGSAAGPLGVPNLNVQVDGRYMHHWGDFCGRS